MSTIRVVSKRLPKKGHYIDESTYNYFLTPDGLPAFAFRWQGMMFPGSKAQFVFARDVVRIGHISEDVTQSQTRWSGFSQSSSKVPGLIPGLIAGAIGAATARTSNMKGLGVFYNNEDGHLGAFLAVASPEIVDEIFRSIPPERHEKDTEPSSDQPAP